MTRLGMLIGSIALTLLGGCGGGGGGNGFTTPDGDPFGGAFAFFLGGSIFPTMPDSEAEAIAGVEPSRGTADFNDGIFISWDFVSYNAPDIQVRLDGAEPDQVRIDWNCGGCSTEEAEDYLAIFEAALEVLTDRFGTPTFSDNEGDDRSIEWETATLNVLLSFEATDGAGVGDTHVIFTREG